MTPCVAPVTLALVGLVACGPARRATSQPAPTIATETAQQSFGDLKQLVGRWTCATATADPVTVDLAYRLVAADSVLVETFASGPGRETLILFHLDGSSLLATHYCAQGNQPRLSLRRASDRTLEFRFQDATNLASPTASHLHRLELTLTDPDHYVKVETYLEDGKEDTTRFQCERIPSGN